MSRQCAKTGAHTPGLGDLFYQLRVTASVRFMVVSLLIVIVAALAGMSVVGGEHSTVAQVKAELARARHNLAQTTVTAAVDGVIDNLQLRVGATVRTVALTGERPMMNTLAMFWLWVGAKLDYIY